MEVKLRRRLTEVVVGYHIKELCYFPSDNSGSLAIKNMDVPTFARRIADDMLACKLVPVLGMMKLISHPSTISDTIARIITYKLFEMMHYAHEEQHYTILQNERENFVQRIVYEIEELWNYFARFK